MTISTFDGWRLTTSNTTNTATTASTNTLSFAWFGSDADRTSTWEFADLGQFQECEPERFNQWRDRVENDTQYHDQQLLMNRRHDQWHTQTQTTGTTSNSLHLTSGTATDTNGTFWITSDITRAEDFRLGKIWNNPWIWKLKPILYKIHRLKQKFNKYLKFNRTAEEIQRQKAEKKSWELVKDWLSPEEFAQLTSKGEMEIQSKEDLETIYIVKKDPLATVQEIKKGNKVKSMCLISKEAGLATGDALLSKIMLLKTDEKQFKKIAVVQNRA